MYSDAENFSVVCCLLYECPTYCCSCYAFQYREHPINVAFVDDGIEGDIDDDSSLLLGRQGLDASQP